MGSLKNYSASSKVMDISIRIGKERFKFNLHDELKVDEDTVSSEIFDQSNSYAFLLMVRAKLNKYVKSLTRDRNDIRTEVWERVVKSKNTYTGRSWNKDEVQFQIDNDPEVDKITDKLLSRQHELELIENAIKSFEQRSDLIRTISANLRSQKL